MDRLLVKTVKCWLGIRSSVASATKPKCNPVHIVEKFLRKNSQLFASITLESEGELTNGGEN